MDEIKTKDIILRAKRDKRFKKDLLKVVSKKLIDWDKIGDIIASYTVNPLVDVFDIERDEFGVWNYNTEVYISIDDIIEDIKYKLEVK